MYNAHDSLKHSDDVLLRVPQKACLVMAKWHWEIVDATRVAAISSLKQANPSCDIVEYLSPGTLEIPQLIHAVLKQSTQKPDVVIALGCIVKGETAHFDLIATTVFESINKLALEENVVMTNGILTVDTLAQAQDRAGGSKGNKGHEAAQAALDLFSQRERIV